VTAETPSLTRLYAKALVPVRHRPDRLIERSASASVSVDRSALAHYQRVCSFDVSDVVPSTYLHVLAFPLAVAIMSDREFPLPLAGMLHASNFIHQARPVSVGEPVELTVSAENLRPHRVGREVDIVAEAKVRSAVVWSERSTYLRRETRPDGGQRPTDGIAESAEDGAVARWQIPADVGRRYAAVSGDRNPIHLNPLVAKAFGFPRAIAHGMWLHARALASLGARLPGSYRVDVDFKAPVFLPSTVAVSTRPTSDGFRLEVRRPRDQRPHMLVTTAAAD
jgi:acyl dehydratase